MRKVAQPLKIVGSQLVARPDRRGRGHGIKVVEVHETGGCLVVITSHEDPAKLTRALRHFVRTCAVTHDVAEVNDLVVGGSSCQASIKRFQVGVDVTEQQYAHGSPDELPIIDGT